MGIIIRNGIEYGGKTFEDMTYEEYQALPEAVKNDGAIRHIYDRDINHAFIDDTISSDDMTWSSNKLKASLNVSDIPYTSAPNITVVSADIKRSANIGIATIRFKSSVSGGNQSVVFLNANALLSLGVVENYRTDDLLGTCVLDASNKKIICYPNLTANTDYRLTISFIIND